MARLPVVGQDGGSWGDVLNEFLLVGHEEDGSTIGGSSSGGLPPGWINVLDEGLVDDAYSGGAETDNTAALEALIATVPINATGAGTTFVWPSDLSGQYGFSTAVDWQGKSIRNIGLGSSMYTDQRYLTGIKALSNSMTIFDINGGASNNQQGPSFENFGFTGNSHTSVTCVYVHSINRCHFYNCRFYLADVGLNLEEGAFDCAFHHFQNLGFYACKSGFKSSGSNSWRFFGGDFVNCGTALDFSGLTVTSFVYGAKINSPAASNAIWSGGAKVGLSMAQTGSVGNIIDLYCELGNVASSGRVAVNIASGVTGNIIRLATHGGGNASNTNKGVVTAGGGNIIDIYYQTGFPTNADVYTDTATTPNRRNGFYSGLASERPTASVLNAGRVFAATDTSAISVSTGTTWVTVS